MQQRWNPNSSSDEDDDSWPRQTEPMLKRRRKLLVVDEEEVDDSGGEEVADEDMEVLNPIGEVVRVSGSGGQKINHYKAFDFAGNIYKLGRPKGVTPKYSLAPLVPRLSELIGFQVVKAVDCIGLEVEKLVASLPGDGVLFLENVRFYKEEEKIEPEFAKKLASLADLFVIQCPNGAAFSMGLLFRDRIHASWMKLYIEHLTEAITLNPASAIMYATRATVYIKMNKPNADIRDASAALELYRICKANHFSRC